MIKMSLKLNDFLSQVRAIKELRKDSAKIIANVVCEEFIELLKNAPQYSGNYVANMAIAAGLSMGRKEGYMIYSRPKNVTEALARGSMPAIEEAKRENSNMVKNITVNVERGGWVAGMTIYNRLNYAKYVEDADHLRTENSGGEHAIQQCMNKIQSRSRETIVHGSPEYNRLLGIEAL